MNEYNPKEIEAKWQGYWEERKLFHAKDGVQKPKYYTLIEFPYPSGEGLHVGHPRPYIGMDVISRKRRMEGYEVLFPIGWDAFGLPAENYALKTGVHPRETTTKNIGTFKRQIKSLGISFDWSREINTTEPEYYKWTQWLFLKFFENNLAYKAKMNINWCPKDKIGLANEEVIDGKCERCGTPVEKREREQWMLKITAYADRLDKDLDTVDYPERVKLQQRNWIGKSQGAEIDFAIKDSEESVKIYTTRPDTIFGATYAVLAPEHELIKKLGSKIENLDEVKRYVDEVKNKEEIERTAEDKEKTGVELRGVRVINPATNQEIPLWVADYVLPHYGTGAIMSVPAHDARDRSFAERFKLPIIEDYPFAGLEDFGKKVTKFKLRDWVFARQRYWGEPIPVVHCAECGMVPVPESDLPVVLPDLEEFRPGPEGESPLANAEEWVKTTCPKCGGGARRETDTMPQWAGSSWYFMRYTDSKNDKEFASKDKLARWIPVDWYNGGMEHTTLHLLYSRFWNKFLFDLGLVPASEPYSKRTSHGVILAEGGAKMSKSKGNVVNPDDIVKRFGADTLRVYEMFMGPFEQAIAWSEDALVGPRRFIERVWKLQSKVEEIASIDIDREIGLNQLIQKVSGDIETMSFNTAISAMMVFLNGLEKHETVSKEEYETLLLLLSPFAPHVTEELWSALGHNESVVFAPWPIVDESKLSSREVTMAVQINGKTRTTIKVDHGAVEEAVKSLVLELPEVKKWLNGATPKRVIIVLGKIVNIVV